MTTKCFLAICLIISCVAIFFPTRHARHYAYVEPNHVYQELELENRPLNSHNLKLCNIEIKISNSSNIEIKNIFDARNFHTLKPGGEYVPKSCQSPLPKVAVIVPYRNRSQQLNVFLSYMHPFLQGQDLAYRIFVVNQNDTLPFNRAKMLNFGAKTAMQMNYNCLILHDVDLIPLNTGNIYACARKPRHMSSSLDSFRFNLPYLTLFGGAVSMKSEHFRRINGMSNQFSGWGGEDDDFYRRLEAHDLAPYRFAPQLSQYTMLIHKREKANQDRFNRLKYSMERHRTDGLSSLPEGHSVKLEDLFTLVIAS